MEYLSNKSSVARMDKNLEKISPFELKNRLIEMADESVKKMAHVMLNAGRGNPNWIATEAREAFFALGGFGIEECRRVMDMPEGIAGIPQKTGIGLVAWSYPRRQVETALPRHAVPHRSASEIRRIERRVSERQK